MENKMEPTMWVCKKRKQISNESNSAFRGGSKKIIFDEGTESNMPDQYCILGWVDIGTGTKGRQGKFMLCKPKKFYIVFKNFHC
jgi:hypothetical protein